MTRERAKELLPVIQAYAEGKDVQYSNSFRNPDSLWTTAIEPTFDAQSAWRIKPEPMELWIFESHLNDVKRAAGSESVCTCVRKDRATGYTKFREVLE